MQPALRPSDDTIARLRFEAEARSAPIAYLLWFFLGYGGVHRMYLGRWISGLVMLAIFSLSLLLTLVLIGYIGLGFIILWWVTDALLIPGMVQGANNRLLDRMIR